MMFVAQQNKNCIQTIETKEEKWQQQNTLWKVGNKNTFRFLLFGYPIIIFYLLITTLIQFLGKHEAKHAARYNFFSFNRHFHGKCKGKKVQVKSDKNCSN